MTRKYALGVFALIAGALIGCGDDDPAPVPMDAAVEADTLVEADAPSTPDVEASADVVDDLGEQSDPGIEPTPSTLDYDLTQLGPFGVGYRTWNITYTPQGVADPREIPVHVWYPSTVSEGDHPTSRGIHADPVSVIDAEPAPPVAATYPVHVYSHGHQGFGGTSADLMRYFASHGWVVVAPDHLGDLLGDNFESEELTHYLKRPQDVSAALDALDDLAASDLLSKADTSRALLSGHSRGTYTVWGALGATYDLAAIAAAGFTPSADEKAALEAGFGDARFVAGVPMAGTYGENWFGEKGYAAVSAPVLALTGSLDGPEGAQAQFDTLGGLALTWVELAGGCHQTFALGYCDTLDPAEGFRIVNTYSLAFARKWVQNDDGETTAGILDGSAEVSKEATFNAK